MLLQSRRPTEAQRVYISRTQVCRLGLLFGFSASDQPRPADGVDKGNDDRELA
jgi:hypothetical protein